MGNFDLEQLTTSSKVVNDCLQVKSGESVLIVTDENRRSVGYSIARVCKVIGAKPMIILIPISNSHGNEPPEAVTQALKNVDVAFTCTTKDLTHTRARLDAANQGRRFGIFGRVTEKMMTEGAMTVDFDELKVLTDRVAHFLNEASQVHVKSNQGTNIEFRVKESTAFSLDGYYSPEKGFGGFPPGEVPLAPDEGTANGKIVIDVCMDDIGWLDDSITLNFQDGLLTEIDGGPEANQLNEIIKTNDKNARNLAEFAIGTNWEAKIIGNVAEDKKRLGTVHFAIGDNESLGGTVQSDIHLDGVVKYPTVSIDEEVIIRDGEIIQKELKSLIPVD